MKAATKMGWTKGQSGNPRGAPVKYASEEEREAAKRASFAKSAQRRAVELDVQRNRALANFANRPAVSVDDPLSPADLERAMGIETGHDTLLHLGRLGERVAIAGLIKSVLDEDFDPKIRAQNMRALLQGWSAAPKQSINLQVNTERLNGSELIELGRQMFASPVIDITPAGLQPSGHEAISQSLEAPSSEVT